MCLQKIASASHLAAHRRSAKVPIVMKFSSLRLTTRLLIIIFFLFLQFFASPASSNRHHLSSGGTLPLARSHTQSQTSSSSSPPSATTHHRRTTASLIGNHHQQSKSYSSSSSTADWHSQRHAKQPSSSSSSAVPSKSRLTEEPLIATESRVTPSKMLLSPGRNDAAYDDHHQSPDNQTTQSTSFQCPEQFGYFADSADCTRYFVCVFGEALHETCTGGLYFSSELQTCDWPQNVICQKDSYDSSAEKLPSSSVNKDDEDFHWKQKTPKVVAGEKKRKPAPEENSSFSTESSVEEDFGSNDLEQPAFDESIASFIDQNGDVYVHDGPGGLYSLIERTAAISDHDKPIVFRSAPAAALAAVNSIEKKTHTEKPLKKLKPKCTKNCTANQNVQFDDDELVEEQSYGSSGSPQQRNHQPEHLRPRPNIVKKQLKDFPLEYHNKVDELKEEEEQELEEDRSADQVNGTSTIAVAVKQATESPVITFVANKNDMWTDDSSKLISNVNNKYSFSQNPNNKYSDENAQKISKQLSYKLRRSEKDAGTTSILTEDSILQVFRGVPNTSRRNHYLLESFNTLPLPFPANLVKPWKSSPSFTPVNQEGKRNGKQIAPVSYGSSNGTQTMAITGNGNSTKGGKPVSGGTEIHIFYSYRNPHKGNKLKAPVQAPSIAGNLPVPTTMTVSRLKESNREQQPLQLASQSTAEIFTMRSSELLMSRNATTTTTTTSTPPTTNAPMTTLISPPSASVNLHLDYRYPGMAKPTNRNAGRSTTTTTTTTTAPTPPVLYYQSLYTNYSHYDELFGQVKKSLESVSTSTTPTTTVTSTTTSTTTTTPSSLPASVEKLPSEEGDHQSLDIVEEVAEAVSPKHNFISYSAPNESARPKGAIPSICDPSLNCKLPKCFCPGTKAPYGFKRSETPQMILLTFDDAVNDVNFPLYEEIFEEISASGRRRTNPNGCPIRAVFFVSHEWTDYGKVQTLYARGHEIASHSITHRFGEKFSTEDWRREHVGQREILHRYANIPREDIRGTRAAFLQIGGDKQFQMLMDGNFSYDSSVSIFDNSPPFWPYTLDFAFDMQHDCMISPCPTRSYPGLWEIGLVMWQNLPGGGRCTMGNSCNSPPDEQAVYELIMGNFKRHYESNRAPFPMAYHSAWFTTPHHKAGFLRFIDEVLQLGDVFFVTNQQALQWMRQPTKLAHIDRFKPWQCPQQMNPSVPKKVLECLRPNICLVKFRKKNSVGSRYFKTCQVCPTDYPWIDTLDRLQS